MNNFKISVRNYNWYNLRSSDINIFTANIISKLNELYCKHFPIKVKNIKHRNAINPWVTPELNKLIEAKYHYFQLYNLGLVSREENNKI